jgi:poly(A) polymerase
VKPDSAAEIVAKLRDHGHEAYFVGGCVRDMVLGIEPADYDIATDALPEQVIRLFARTEPVGAKFGVVLVIHRGHPYEVATFRSDEAYVDGRRPTGVVFTNARQDVLRRDFTINGLLYDPVTREILDYVDGQADIRARVVRAIGDPLKRFEEDKLRILRGVRFGARLGYTIEPATWTAMLEMAPSIHQVSRERIRSEIVRILTEGDPARGLQLLEESALLREILPELDYTEHLKRCLKLMKPGSAPDFAMAVLLHEVPPAQIVEVLERLKFSNAESHHIVELAQSLPLFPEMENMSISAIKRFFRLNRFEDHLELERIHAIAGDGNLRAYSFASAKFRGLSPSDIAPPSLISGDDLIAEGYPPGPRFKEILMRVENEQLEGKLQSRQEALDFVRLFFPLDAGS